MIAALGHISGGHFNPAVTVGLTVGGKHPATELLQYIVAQVIGGVVAALLAILIYDGIGTFDKANLVTKPGADVSSGKAMIIELIATLLFLMVISAVATDKNAPWNGIQAPIFIGLFIFTAATVFGPLSGGSFNPAVLARPGDHRGRVRRRLDLPDRPHHRWCHRRRRVQVVPHVRLTHVMRAAPAVSRRRRSGRAARSVGSRGRRARPRSSSERRGSRGRPAAACRLPRGPRTRRGRRT